MEACVRGFSFMPDSHDATAVDLQYIEGSELERAWKATRRERVKAQEKRIWSDFVNDHDSSTALYNNDPYQFLERLPEGSLRELMDATLAEMRAEAVETTAQSEPGSDPEEQQKQASDAPHSAHTVTFADSDLAAERDDDVFHLFHDEDDNDDGQVSVSEENEEEMLGSSDTTMRKQQQEPSHTATVTASSDKQSSKSENVCDTVTNSIYCAKVKELRGKICEELLNINLTMENKLYSPLDGEELSKSQKRGAEFCTRFNRIHLYQITRQINDITRNNSSKLPFARHTQFQAQMVRAVSLHQNVLHALHALHKYLTANAIAREVCACATDLCAALREGGSVAAAVPAPAGCAEELYSDNIDTTSQMLESTVKAYEAKVDECLSEYMAQIAGSQPYTSNVKARRHKKTESIASGPRSNSGSARLSMYTTNNCDKKILYQIMKKHEKPKEPEKVKSPKSSRRPLMRAPPPAPRPRRSRPRPPDGDIATMVEAFDPSVSNLMSREPSFCNNLDKMASSRPKESPNMSPRRTTNNSPRRMHADSPARRTQTNTPRRSHGNTPRMPHDDLSPKSSHNTPRRLTSSVAPKNKKTTDSKQKVLPDKDKNKDLKINLAVECDLEKSDNIEKIKKKVDVATDKRAEEEDELQRNAESKGHCSGDGPAVKTGRSQGARNAQLLCVRASSPRQEHGGTTELLKILEKTIHRKKPKSANPDPPHNTDRFHLKFHVPEAVTAGLLRHRASFLQHMLASPLYANSVLGRPWEVIGSVSDEMVDELVRGCVQDMEIRGVVDEMFRSETT
ncbi:uncharacterized protein LOC105389374 isoform X2 [Plutella xylostella]|uniref:uncharacterized protein LOC105389374 isoform X2 n=1 Tax=Plutella xylostella TaxID=51655 RepID=UPI0020324AA0|nr:uncharacterized protein LOC105389374 isoform X2 [Plutella xylostella]